MMNVSTLPRRAFSVLLAASLMLSSFGGPAGAGQPQEEGPRPPAGDREGTGERPGFVPGEMLVRFRATASPSARAAVRSRQNLEKVKDLPLPGLELVRVKGVGRIPDRAAQVQAEAAVRYAHPNHLWYPAGGPPLPNDPEFDELWGLHNPGGRPGWTADADIDWPEAQEIAAPLNAQEQMVVAVIDTGIDIDHPDLADRIWTNPSPDPEDQDLHGWDFYNNDNTVFDEVDGDDHGTHVAGTIAALIDNAQHVTGVSRAQIMPLKFLGPPGGFTSDAIEAIHYAIQNGADVINASWGGSGFDQALKDKIDDAGSAGMLFVAAAGNSGKNTDQTANAHYPSSYDSDNIISVAATTASNGLASFSNYGATTVDLGAPGSSILSTVPRLGKAVLTGPDISGGAAYHTAYHTFGLEGIADAQHRRDILHAALTWMGLGGSDSILVVPDAAQQSGGFVSGYTGALQALGYTNVSTHDEVPFPNGNQPCNSNNHSGPSLAQMTSHKAVIWFTGSTFRCTLTSADRTNLNNYLNPSSGPKGKLLLFGQDIGFDLTRNGTQTSTFLQNVLRTDYVADYDVNFRVSGMPGTPFAAVPTVQLSSADPASTPGGQLWSSAIASRSGAVTAMRGAYTTWFNGTSMATPHVAGAVAQLLAKFPEMDHLDVKARIMNRGDPLPALSGKTVSGKRLNLHKALQGDGPAAPTNLTAVPKAAGRIDLSWTASAGPDLAGYNVYRGDTAGFTPGPSNRQNDGLVTDTSYADEDTTDGTTHHYVVRAVDTEGTESDDSNRVSATADNTPPQVSAKSPAAGATGVSLSSPVTATFDEAVDPATVTGSSFTLEEDGAGAAAGTVSYDAATRTVTFTPDDSLEELTSYTAEVTTDVTDIVGNPLSETVSWTFQTADATAPTVLITAPPAAVLLSGASVSIEGSASDNAAVTLVEVAIQNAAGHWWNGAAFQPAQLWISSDESEGVAILPAEGGPEVTWSYEWPLPESDGGAFTIMARASDDSMTSEAVSRGVTVDTVAPTGSLAIDEGTHTPTRNVTLTLTGSDGGPGGLEMRIANDVPPTGDWVPFAASVPWELSAGPDGERTVHAELRDGAGNVGDVLEASIVLDTTPPEITGAVATPEIFSPALGNTTTITASVSDATPVDWAVQVGLDKSLFFDEGQGPDVEVVWDGADADDGEYTFEVTAVDAAGNEAVPVTGTVTVDGTPPEVTILSSPDPLTNQTSAAFTFSADEDASFECRLDWTGPDAEGWEACVSPEEYTDLGDGGHTFEVQGTDEAGNSGSAVYEWTVDATPPTIISMEPEPNDTDVPIGTNVTVTFSEPIDEATLSLTLAPNGGPEVAGTLAYDATSWTATLDPTSALDFDTLYTAQVGADDLAGNSLSGDTSWTFTTAAEPAEPELDDTPEAINTTSTSFSFSSSEGEEFECRWYPKDEPPGDDEGWETECNSPKEVKDLHQGIWVFEVRVVVGDKVGPSASHEWIVDMTAPTNHRVTRDGGRFQNSRTFGLSFDADDNLSGVASYQVQRRLAPWNGKFGDWGPWDDVEAAGDGEVTVANEAEAEDTVARGRTVCYRAKATDLAGNQTPDSSSQACTAIPLNNTQLDHRKKWAKKKGDGFYENTYSQTRTRGSALIRTGVRAKRLAVVATRCGTCGTIDVFWGTTRLKRINLTKGTRGKNQIIPVKTFKKVRKGRVRIRVVSSNRLVRIEGLGVSRV